MKYLYQQLLAFIGVIALIILIVGTSFTQLTKRTMQENNYEQLYGYAESALETRDFFINVAGVSDRDVLSYSFQLTERVLQKKMCNLCLLTRTAKCSTHQLIAQKN